MPQKTFTISRVLEQDYSREEEPFRWAVQRMFSTGTSDLLLFKSPHFFTSIFCKVVKSLDIPKAL